MAERRIEKPPLVTRIATRIQKDASTVETILDAALEEIYRC